MSKDDNPQSAAGPHVTVTASEVPKVDIGAATADLCPSVVIVHHPDWAFVGLRAPVRSRGALLGRSAQACLPGAFEVNKVSREHARVFVERGRVLIEDQQSRNGTLVNGERVTRATLTIGDVVGIGGILLMVVLAPPSFAEPSHPDIVGKSWPVARLLEDVTRVGASQHTVTLLGETGTGKELVAKSVHATSGRAGRLVAVNCGALAEGLLESELFGHEQGAFTGAAAPRPGLIAQAEGGTLFLDEVTSTPPRLQATLLRLLENGTYRPVGSNDEQTADVRVVAAAQPDILTSIDSGGFRADLWFRLSRRVITVPPLRERTEDIPLLARHFARAIKADAELSSPLSRALIRAHWRGNVRELRNIVEQIADVSQRSLLADASLVPSAAPRSAEPAQTTIRQRRAKRRRPPRRVLEHLLQEHAGRVAAVATALSVNKKTVYRWLEAHGLEPGSTGASAD